MEGRYTAVARWLHWIIAILVIWNIASGIAHEGLPRDESAVVMDLHKSVGVTILALVLLRFLWRLGHKPPALPAGMTPWQARLAHITHWTLYALMVVLPITGWLFVSAGPTMLQRPFQWFGLFDLPRSGLARTDPITGIAHISHVLLGFLMAALVLMHIAAVFWHQFGRKDDLIRRMW